MRIAQVSPLYESVPPKLYGGTERVVNYITEELVRLGHSVTLFASGDSITTAKLFACCQTAVRLDPDSVDGFAPHFLLLERVFQAAAEFDILHFHIDYLHFPFSRRCKVPSVTTLHGRLDIPDLQPLFKEFSDIPVVSISDEQRLPLAWANWQGTVYHGLPLDLLSPGNGQGGYLAFLGRISPEKRVDRAIEISRRAGIPLKIAAKIEKSDREYFETQIEHLIEGPLVEYLGEIAEHEKAEFLGHARALLFPIDWPEPFGLVMIEALSCATPVVAFRGGSVEEVIDHGVTGFVVDDIEEALRAVQNLDSIDRNVCRRVFEERFSSRRMAEDYLKIYERLQSSGPPQPAELTEMLW